MAAYKLGYTNPEGQYTSIQFDQDRFRVFDFPCSAGGRIWKVEIITIPFSVFTDWDLNGLCYNMQQAGFPNCRVVFSTSNNPLQYVLICDTVYDTYDAATLTVDKIN
jgi:hypothetical protein